MPGDVREAARGALVRCTRIISLDNFQYGGTVVDPMASTTAAVVSVFAEFGPSGL